MKTNFVQKQTAASLFGVSIQNIRKIQIWWKVVLVVGQNFSRFVSKTKFLLALKAAFNDVLFSGIFLQQKKEIYLSNFRDKKPNNEIKFQRINSRLPKGFKITYETNLFGSVIWILWREEKKKRKIVNSFKLAEFEDNTVKFITYWRTRLVSPECRYKKASSPLYLVEVASDYKKHIESKQAKADLGI